MYDGSQLSIFIIEVDEEGDFRYGGLNKAHSETTGLTNEMIVGKPPEEIPWMTADGAALMRSNYTRCVETGEAIQYEEMLEFYGTPSVWLTILSPLKNHDGRIYRLIGMSLDITQQREIQKQLHNAQLNQLRLENDRMMHNSKSEMLSMIAHEFNAPLSVLGTSSYLIKKTLGEEEFASIETYIERLQTQSTLMNQLLERMTKLNKTYKLEDITLELVDIELFIVSIVADIQLMRIDANSIVTQFDVKTQPKILIAREFLRQIVTNLLSNAVKYTLDDAEVKITCTIDEHLEIKVRDQGIGIPADELNTIFEPFKRGDNVGIVQGTGIGLATVKYAVDALKGTITVDSTEGIGTEFVVQLPLTKIP
ncbi:MAG: PAS domain-containing sensor histidine kinase [Chloroflexota bacterium]